MQKSADLDIDLNVQSENGMTAYHYACHNNHFNIVERIIDNWELFRIDLTIQNNNNRTAYQMAEDNEHFSLAEFIKDNLPNKRRRI